RGLSMTCVLQFCLTGSATIRCHANTHIDINLSPPLWTGTHQTDHHASQLQIQNQRHQLLALCRHFFLSSHTRIPSISNHVCNPRTLSDRGGLCEQVAKTAPRTPVLDFPGIFL